MKSSHYFPALAVASALQATPSQAIDLQPGEVRAPPPGINLFQLNYQHSERGDRYIHGEKQPGKPELTLSQLHVRLGRSFEAAGRPVFFYAQTPIGNVQPSGALSSHEKDAGIGDTTLLLATWPLANHATQTYFAVAGYLIIPTGSYRAERRFNMGANRYSTALQAAYQTALTDQLHWTGAVDAMWYGSNSDFGAQHAELKQDALYTAQTGLRYDFTPRYALAATYFHSVGGETRVNGVVRDDWQRLKRYQLSGVASFPSGRIALQYGADLHTEHGFIEDSRWIVRYMKFF